jgi:hypothetical protein
VDLSKHGWLGYRDGNRKFFSWNFGLALQAHDMSIPEVTRVKWINGTSIWFDQVNFLKLNY